MADWRDPENQAPRGLGCWNCHVYPPVVFLALRSGYHRQLDKYVPFSRPYALCLRCLGLWFPHWDLDQVADWLERQQQQAREWEHGKAARREADDRHLAGWLAGVFQ